MVVESGDRPRLRGASGPWQSRRGACARGASVLGVLLLACRGAPAGGDEAGPPGGAHRAADPVVRALSVAREDQEPCAKDADCDDWCKERLAQQWASCLCRCPGFVPEAELSCKSEARFCQPAPAPFWGGSFNVTSGKPFKAKCKKHPLMLAVFSARSCLHCIDFEPSYRWGAEALAPLGIPLARIDVDVEKDFANEHSVSTLPHIAVFHKCKAKGTYKGFHSPAALKVFGEKLKAAAVRDISTEAELEAFAGAHNVSVLGFFASGSGAEDEEEEFQEAAETFRFAHNVYFARVVSRDLLSTYGSKGKKWFTKSPSVVIVRNFDEGDRDVDAVLATELSDTSLQQWIEKRTVRIVDEITGLNFAYYESLRLPMLLLFVDKSHDNRKVQEAFKAVAKGYQGKVSFAYIDGKAHASRKMALGLVDDVLPAMGFNTLSGTLYPFPTHKPLTQQSIKEHVEGYLTGRLQPTQASSSPEEMKAAEEEAERLGAEGLIEVSRKTFADVCMDESKDVLVLFYAAAQQVTKDFWPYWRKTVERFRQLGIGSLKIAQYDMSRNQLPEQVEIDSLPALVMFPAKDKAPPFKLFHGKAKVRPIMEWAREVASIKFEYPNDTPHLDDSQREAYLVQVKERDERVSAQRAQAKAERIEKLKHEGLKAQEQAASRSEL